MSDFREENCRVAVVSRQEGDRAQLIYLHSYRAVASDLDDFEERTFFNRDAIDSDQPPSLAIIDYLEKDAQTPFERSEYEDTSWIGGGAYGVIDRSTVPEIWSRIGIGSLLHIHSFSRRVSDTTTRFWEEHCLSPIQLDETGVLRAIERADAARRQRLNQEVRLLESQEQGLLDQYEVLEDPAEAHLLFEGLQRIADERGRVYFKVPPRVIVSKRHGILLLAVRLSPHPDMREDSRMDWTGDVRYLVAEDETSAQEIWTPYNIPLEEVDARGVPLERHKMRFRVSLDLYNPYRSLNSTRGLEEQRAIVEANGRVLHAQLDPEIAIGNQGLGGITFSAFIDAAQGGTYHEVREVGQTGSGRTGEITSPIPSVILISEKDLEGPLDFLVRLPAFDEI